MGTLKGNYTDGEIRRLGQGILKKRVIMDQMCGEKGNTSLIYTYFLWKNKAAT